MRTRRPMRLATISNKPSSIQDSCQRRPGPPQRLPLPNRAWTSIASTVVASILPPLTEYKIGSAAIKVLINLLETFFKICRIRFNEKYVSEMERFHRKLRSQGSK